jgi:hypothetical protein
MEGVGTSSINAGVSPKKSVLMVETHEEVFVDEVSRCSANGHMPSRDELKDSVAGNSCRGKHDSNCHGLVEISTDAIPSL